MALRLRTNLRGARKRSGAAAPVRNDDDLSEGLPPTDGLVGDREEDENLGAEDLEGMHELGDEHELEANLLDDHALGDAAVMDDADAREPERGWLDDSDEAAGLDVGEEEVEIGDESSASLDDSTEPDADDDDPALDPGELGTDAGEEGIEGEDDELREEDLPALDADDDGEVDERSLYEAPESALEVDPELAWDDRAWGFDLLDPTPAVGFAAGEAALFACAGAALVRLAPGSVARVAVATPERAHRGAVDPAGDAWLVAASGALLRLARGSSATVRVNAAPAQAIDVAAADGGIWVLDAAGVVSVSRDRGATFRPAADDVLALGGSAERAVVLVSDAKGLRELVFEGGGTQSSVLPFAADATLPGADVAWELVVRGDVSVVFAHGVGVYRRTVSTGWQRIASSADAFAVTILGDGGEDDGLLLALSDMEEPTRLAYVAASGHVAAPSPRVVAELAPGEDTVGGETAGDEEISVALATLDGDAVVAGPFGTRKLAPLPPRH